VASSGVVDMNMRNMCLPESLVLLLTRWVSAVMLPAGGRPVLGRRTGALRQPLVALPGPGAPKPLPGSEFSGYGRNPTRMQPSALFLKMS
jgi:hypothetical protein